MQIQTRANQGKTIAIVRSDTPLLTDLQAALDLMATVKYEVPDTDAMVCISAKSLRPAAFAARRNPPRRPPCPSTTG